MSSDITTIKQLLTFVVAPPPPQPEVLDRIKAIDKQLKDLSSFGRKPKFAFENTPNSIKEKKAELLQQRFIAESKMTQILMASKGYPQELDYSPLGWIKNDSMLPAFFIVNIKHSAFTLAITHRSDHITSLSVYGNNVNQSYPEAIRLLYRDAAQKIVNKQYKNWSETLTTATAKFQGILPEGTRTKIQTALKSKLFNDIYIITEAQNWTIEDTIIAKNDPIIVGWVKKTQQMFIVDIFDPTPLENYLTEQHIK